MIVRTIAIKVTSALYSIGDGKDNPSRSSCIVASDNTGCSQRMFLYANGTMSYSLLFPSKHIRKRDIKTRFLVISGFGLEGWSAQHKVEHLKFRFMMVNVASD